MKITKSDNVSNMGIVEYIYGKYFFEPIGTEKGKLIEK
jgi:hypothetical protein